MTNEIKLVDQIRNVLRMHKGDWSGEEPARPPVLSAGTLRPHTVNRQGLHWCREHIPLIISRAWQMSMPMRGRDESRPSEINPPCLTFYP